MDKQYHIFHFNKKKCTSGHIRARVVKKHLNNLYFSDSIILKEAPTPKWMPQESSEMFLRTQPVLLPTGLAFLFTLTIPFIQKVQEYDDKSTKGNQQC